MTTLVCRGQQKQAVKLTEVERAARLLHQGGVVGHATEGVWGLTCDPANADAVRQLLHLKGRSETQGLILIAAHVGMFAPWLNRLSENDLESIQASWPGPVTWIVPDHDISPTWVRGKRNSIAIRVPDHQQMQELSLTFGGPIVSTSANPSGEQAARSEQEVRRFFADELDYILPSGQAESSRLSGRASMIYDALTRACLRP